MFHVPYFIVGPFLMTKGSRVLEKSVNGLLESYKIDKPLSGLIIMSLAEGFSSKFHICPRSFASGPNVQFSDNLSDTQALLCAKRGS